MEYRPTYGQFATCNVRTAVFRIFSGILDSHTKFVFLIFVDFLCFLDIEPFLKLQNNGIIHIDESSFLFEEI